jgi:hypothetical protein
LVSEQFLNYWTVAVNIGGNWTLYDPCAEVPLPAGTVPWEVEGQLALMAMPQAQTFLNVPPASAESSRAETTADLKLSPDGDLDGECLRTFTGHYAHFVRQRLHDIGQEEWWQLTRPLLDLENSSSEVRLLKIEGLDSIDGPVRLRASVHWPAFAAILNDRIVLPLSIWHVGQPPLLNELKRTTSVFFQFPRLETETVTVHLPANFRPEFLPKPISARHGDFSYALAVTHDHARGLLKVERSAINRAIDIRVADYPKARDWFRRVSVADQIGTLLTRSSKPLQK